MLGKGWDNHTNNLTPFYNGNRHIYVQSPVVPPLPKDIVLDDIPCKLWHKSQTNYCQRCNKVGHKTTNHNVCEAYIDEIEGVLFRSYKDPLSNFYKCKLQVEDLTFFSSEQYYQYLKCDKVCNIIAKQKVLASSTAAEAKLATKHLTAAENKVWREHCNEAMYKVLTVKAEQCSAFLNALIDSGTSHLFEATSDDYWGCGLDLKYAKNTNPNFYPGNNVLGDLLEKIRDDFVVKDVRPLHTESNNIDSSNIDTSYVEVLEVSKDSESYEVISPSSRKTKKKRNPKSNSSPARRQRRVIQNYYTIDKYLKQRSKKRKIVNPSASSVIS